MAPDLETGKEYVRSVKALGDMTPGEMLETVKNKTVHAGEKAVELGGKAYTSIHDKIASGELKQDAKNMGSTISTSAKGLWGSITNKISGEPKENNK